MTYSAEYQKAYYQKNKKRINARNLLWEKRNPEKVKAYRDKRKARDPEGWKKTRRETSKRWEARNVPSLLWRAAKQRAGFRSLEFSIQPSDIVIPERCPILGTLLNRTHGRMNPASPSLDRIDNSKGYVPGNVWVISWQANRIKCDTSINQLETFCINCLGWIRKYKLENSN